MAFGARLGALTEELVEAVTNTSSQDSPDRAKQYRDGVLRKLKSHPYLRTNPFEVDNNLNGLEERFRVNHRDALADALRQRLDALQAIPSNWHPEALFLLLELSDQPTFKSRLSDLEALRPAEETATVSLRWEDIAQEDGWDQDASLWKSITYGQVSDDDDNNDDDFSDIDSVDESRNSSASEPDDDAALGRTAEDLIIHPENTSAFKSVLEAQQWRNSIPVADSSGGIRKKAVRETQVVREVLFMLQGLETTLFDTKNSYVPSFQIPHMMWETNRAVMNSFGEAGRQLTILRDFVRLRLKSPHMQAFQDSITMRLKTFDDGVAHIQGTIVSPDENIVISLVSLRARLAASLEPFSVLSDVVARINQVSGPGTFRHLELLYDATTLAQLSGKEEIYVFMGRIFMECFNVYLRPVRAWMDEGQLILGDEVFFIREVSTDVPLSDLWQGKFSLRSEPDGTLHVPAFLRPAIHKIMDAGKSIFVLKRLGLNTHYQSKIGSNEEPPLDFDFLCRPEFTLASFPDLFASAFERWIQSKYRMTSTSLKDALFQRCGVWSALDALQYVYLMSDGSAASSFCEDIFSKIDTLNPRWFDRYGLTPVAHDVYGSLVDTNRLSVDVTKVGRAIPVVSARDSVRSALSHIRITYRLAWPIQLVLSASSINHYQAVFTLLLQFKRAAYVLHKHKILDSLGAEEGNWDEQALYYSCRASLLWFCTTIQTYITTLVLTPNALRLRQQLAEVHDVDSIIVVHDAFMKHVMDEVCLGSRLKPIREGMLDVLDLSIKLERCHDAVSSHKDVLEGIKKDFERHLKFISGGLRSVARASSDISSAKWDTLAEMLENGTPVVK